MRNISSLRRALVPSYGAVVIGLFAACSSDPPSDPASGGGGAGGVGGTGGQSTGGAGGTGGTGGTGGSKGGSGGTTGGAAGTGGTGGASGQATGGAGGTLGGAGNVASGGAGMGGNAGAMMGGAAGDMSAGTAGIMAGSGGDAGANGGTAGSSGKANVWQCPAGVTGTPTLGAATRVAGVPPPDDFNMMNNNFGIVEGPVWVDDALYVSEMSYMPYDQANSEVRMSRILKVTSGGQVTIEVADSGSNGLAIDGAGSLLAAVHKDGTIKRIALPGGASQTTVVGTYMNARFNSPNDLAIHSATGTIYFTDPQFQAPQTRPQAATRAYRFAPGGMAEPIPSAAMPDMFNNPNGITLSLAEDFLYVAASNGRRYPVMPDGTLGAGTDFPATTQGDGMAVDCAGNLYVAKANSTNVAVYTPDGTSIGNITVSDVQEVTNVAFGGADHRTLYVTGLGNNKGLFSITMNLPGRPY
jgi:gluconolactonase